MKFCPECECEISVEEHGAKCSYRKKKFVVKAFMKNKIIIQLIKAENVTQAEEDFLLKNRLFIGQVKRLETREKK